MRSFLLTEIDEEEVYTCCGGGRIEFKLIKHIVDAVGTKRDAHARKSGKTEDAREVVVATTARDRTDFYVESFHLKDATGVVVQTTSKGEVEFEDILQRITQCIEHKLEFIATLQAHFARS